MLVNDLLEQLENSPLPPRLLHLIIPAEAILDHAENVQKLRLGDVGSYSVRWAAICKSSTR